MSKTTKPLTELRDADIRRVDAVKGAANGTRFLIAKSAAEGIVSPGTVRDLIAEPPAAHDQYLGVAGELVKAGAEPEPAAIEKEEQTVTTASAPAEEAAPLSIEAARAVLKQAKADERAARADVAKADAEPPKDDAAAADDGDDDTASADVQKAAPSDAPAAPGPAAEPITLEKAKARAKIAKLTRRAAEDELVVAKAREVLAKIGRRNSSGDQAHVDAIDTHAAALGASAHQAPAAATGDPRESVPSLLAKAASDDDQQAVLDVIIKAVGPLLEKNRGEIMAQLTEVSQELAKVGRIALPGGPRAIIERDGSLSSPGDGQMGMTFEQTALAKIASTFPVGSVEREAIEKAGATSAIKDLMLARANA